MRGRIGVALAGVLTLVAGACGGPTPAGETVPALRDRLERVDAALAQGELVRARQALEALTAEARRAEDAGRLSSDQVDRILAAAARLEADLPEAAPPTPSATTPPDPGDEDNSGPGNGDEHGGDGDNSGPGGGGD